MWLTDVSDVNNIILNYYYQLEHYDKYKKCILEFKRNYEYIHTNSNCSIMNFKDYKVTTYKNKIIVRSTYITVYNSVRLKKTIVIMDGECGMGALIETYY